MRARTGGDAPAQRDVAVEHPAAERPPHFPPYGTPTQPTAQPSRVVAGRETPQVSDLPVRSGLSKPGGDAPRAETTADETA
jgi:hypothetical protein